ncbi:MAG TPA: DUF6252 family protein [Gemmatimonadales bacterium]|nr:DUF6252 family protein [Gemmatimonadales bacterium]
MVTRRPVQMCQLLVLAVAVACSDATGPAADTLSALVNGSAFTGRTYPTGSVGLLDTVDMGLTITGIQFMSPTMSENLILSVRGFHGVGQYRTCTTSSYLFGVYFKVDQLDTARLPEYSTTGVCSGEVDVQTYVPITSTIAGTFHFAATSSSAPDTVQVTDGRFTGKVEIAGLILTPTSHR